ncbi:MAG TPA: hypothetical protein VGC67_02035 [Cellulomonas sp.]
MVWFLVWTVLVLAALAGAFVLLRRLWRQGRALVAELERASQVLGELAETTGRIAEQAREAERAAAAVTELLPDPQEAHGRWQELRAQAAVRRERRRERDRTTRERWRAYTR